jgi:hypothetical protein
MANMSYCRFENTLNDMQDCFYELQHAAEGGMSFDQFMKELGSDYERISVVRMVQLMRDMAEAIKAMESNKGLSVEELEEIEA